jgi:hypothetical protein
MQPGVRSRIQNFDFKVLARRSAEENLPEDVARYGKDARAEAEEHAAPAPPFLFEYSRSFGGKRPGMRVMIRGTLNSGSTISGTGMWPDGTPFTPGIHVKFSYMGPRYIGQTDSVVVDLGDETNGKAGQPTLINVRTYATQRAVAGLPRRGFDQAKSNARSYCMSGVRFACLGQALG